MGFNSGFKGLTEHAAVKRSFLRP